MLYCSSNCSPPGGLIPDERIPGRRPVPTLYRIRRHRQSAHRRCHLPRAVVLVDAWFAVLGYPASTASLQTNRPNSAPGIATVAGAGSRAWTFAYGCSGNDVCPDKLTWIMPRDSTDRPSDVAAQPTFVRQFRKATVRFLEAISATDRRSVRPDSEHRRNLAAHRPLGVRAWIVLRHRTRTRAAAPYPRHRQMATSNASSPPR